VFEAKGNVVIAPEGGALSYENTSKKTNV